MNNETQPLIIHGAYESKPDSRTIIEPTKAGIWDKLKDTLSLGIAKTGKAYPNIYSQNAVGICTAAGLITGVWNRTGVRYSEDFQYFLQKKYCDNVNLASMQQWFEGSSLWSALSTGYKFGLVRKELVDKYFIRDVNENYSTYIARLIKAITPEVEAELLKQAEKVISYTQINDLSDANLASFLDDTKSFIYTRNICGDTWYWKVINGVRQYANYVTTKILDPIQTPTSLYFPPSGHAICLAEYNNGKNYANTFGPTWNMDGHAIVAYSPTEAYRVYVNNVPKIVEENKLPKKADFKYTFSSNLYPSPKYSKDTEALQTVLMYENCIDFIPLNQRGYFGAKTLLAVKKFQTKYGITPQSGLVFQKTRAKLNELYG